MKHGTPPEELCRLVAADKVILWVGSGLSAAAGLPLWPQAAARLIQAAVDVGVLAEHDRSKFDKWPPRDIGGKLLLELPERHRAQFFLRNFATENISEAHEILGIIGFKRIITTNWDTLLERMNDHLLSQPDPDRPWQNRWTASFTQKDHEQFAAVGRGDLAVWILHLHGVHHRPNTIVWSESAYDDVMADTVVENLVASSLRDETVLFVGFGLSDEDQDLLLRKVRRQKTTRALHYAILPKDRIQASDLMGKGIVPISYEVSEKMPTALSHIDGIVSVLRDLKTRLPARPSTSKLRLSRAGAPVSRRIQQLRTSPPDSLGRSIGINIYGSSGHDFLTEHQDELPSLLAGGVAIRLLMLDPRVRIELPDTGIKLDLLQWRSGRQPPTQEEADNMLRALEVIETINTAAKTTTSSIKTRLSATFPRNTICQIGEYVFDCPRPTKQLSVQGPMFEYRYGSTEFFYYDKTFRDLWTTGTFLPFADIRLILSL
jgi:hypothetical protein